MLRVVEYLIGGSRLDDPSRVHHLHRVTEAGNNAKVALALTTLASFEWENQELLRNRTRIEENVATRIRRELLSREKDAANRARIDRRDIRTDGVY